MIDEFKALLDERGQIICRKYNLMKNYDTFIKNSDIKLCKSLFPKRKYNFNLISDHPKILARVERVKALSDRFFNHWQQKIDVIEEKLCALAEKIDLKPGAIFSLYSSHSSSTYSSQGFGAAKYCHDAAKRSANAAEVYGIPFEIREVNVSSDNHYGIRHADYEVWVKLSETEIEVLKRKPGLSLRDAIKKSLKGGCNPFVNYPFLPADYLEKNGLDWHGNEIRA